ncbi:response regulator [Methanogenium sp. S4BF]|uniref:ATP-binding response regulator n=1 Tax=Methanogenium sp. S4BF TaxID=1789226 RepID=UPI0024167869|nr:response regulator [Methanogenium sp. S4BF]WFN35563.1 response regulator [Methanogenium sp. S4BF]
MEKKRILIVEDEVIVAMTLEDVLQKLGYQVAGAVTNGPDAIQMAGEVMPDLVLMDIRLDGSMDGIEAATRISSLYSIPVVYLTAHSDQATLSRAIQTQPYGYLLKPFRERDLYTTIEMAFHKHRVIRQTSEPVAKEDHPLPRPREPERAEKQDLHENTVGLERLALESLNVPVCVVDKNLRLVLFNDAFRCLCSRFSTAECGKKQMVYEVAPAVLVGTVNDYREVFARNKPLRMRNVFRQDGGEHAVDIHFRPFVTVGGDSFVVTMVSDATYAKKLESRIQSLFETYDEVLSLLGEFRGLNGHGNTVMQQIAAHAEQVVISLSQIDVGVLKSDCHSSLKKIWDD